MKESIKIDGSYGEGGGQILRTSLSISIATGKPFEIFNIRKGRKNPGLQPQHLTSVRAAKEISSAIVSGDALGSTTLKFNPQLITSGNYNFNVAKEKGSAGSSSLVLQAILLPLSFSSKESKITIEGGTHVSWSPPFHYMDQVLRPLLSYLGFSFSFLIEKWGWYPKGGGIIQASIAPHGQNYKRLELNERGSLKSIQGISTVSNLPLSIAKRQKEKAQEILSANGLHAEINLFEAPSSGTGTFFFLTTCFEKSVAGFSSLGKRGKRAEDVGAEAVKELLDFLDINSALDRYSADQILPYLASIGGEHFFSTSCITQHLLTNVWVIRIFFPNLNFNIDGEVGKAGKISLFENQRI